MTSAAESLRAAAAQGIIVKDGPYGTAIQNLGLTAADYAGHIASNHDQKGNNDILNLTRPDAIAGICNRYIDSNGYSLRINQKDLATSHSLQLVQEGRNLLLLGVPQATGSALVVASAAINNKVGNDGFLALQLAPGWQLSRRTYNGQGLSHIYFSTTKTSSSPPPPPITPRVDTPRGVVPIRVIPYRPMQ